MAFCVYFAFIWDLYSFIRPFVPSFVRSFIHLCFPPSPPPPPLYTSISPSIHPLSFLSTDSRIEKPSLRNEAKKPRAIVFTMPQAEPSEARFLSDRIRKLRDHEEEEPLTEELLTEGDTPESSQDSECRPRHMVTHVTTAGHQFTDNVKENHITNLFYWHVTLTRDHHARDRRRHVTSTPGCHVPPFLRVT